MSYRLRTLLILLAVVAIVVVAGVTGILEYEGALEAGKDLNAVTPAIEARNQGASDLSTP